MWGLWLLPLIVILFCIFVAGVIIAALLAIFGGEKVRRKWWWALAAPFGCLGSVIFFFSVLFLLLVMFGERQGDDRKTYSEIFGYVPTMGDDRMLSSKMGSGLDRRIFLRAEVTSTEKQRMLMTRGLVPSTNTVDDVVELAETQFSWWIEKEPFTDDHSCKGGNVFEAPNFNRWSKFLLVECPKQPDHTFMQLGHTDFVYVIAEGRR